MSSGFAVVEQTLQTLGDAGSYEDEDLDGIGTPPIDPTQ